MIKKTDILKKIESLSFFDENLTIYLDFHSSI